jgi:hypothetical protein
LNADKPKFYRLFELLLKDELATLPAGSRVSLSAELKGSGAKPEIVVQIATTDRACRRTPCASF